MKPEDVVSAYEKEGSLKKVARLFDVSEQKIRKILIDANAYESDTANKVNDMYKQGYGAQYIADKLKMSISAVSSYLPYTKGQYLADEPTENAIRIRQCRQKGTNHD